MTTHRWCGLLLFAGSILLIHAALSPHEPANAQSGRHGDRPNEQKDEGKRKPSLSAVEQLGKELFFDETLSMPHGQACVSCHDPGTGFTSPSSKINAGPAIITGAVEDRAGNRKPPTVAYAGESPVLRFEGIDGGAGRWVGGLFCDGRATGQTLGDPLVEQALEPFVNDVEQNLKNAEAVVRRVARADYAKLFEKAWGRGSLDLDNYEDTFEKIGRSIAAYERSHEVSPFTSKYDFVLEGEAELTEQEARGLALFNGKAACFFCHTSAEGDNGEPPLFTDFTYHNIGTPKNPENPFYDQPRRINPDGADFIDPGLGGFLRDAGYGPDVYLAEMGKHKVPTLRNVDARPHPRFVKAYGHNGFFKSLEEIVHFYNTREVEDWPAPETTDNMNPFIGNLGLTAEEEADVVAFLKTLTDGYKPPRKENERRDQPERAEQRDRPGQPTPSRPR